MLGTTFGLIAAWIFGLVVYINTFLALEGIIFVLVHFIFVLYVLFRHKFIQGLEPAIKPTEYFSTFIPAGTGIFLIFYGLYYLLAVDWFKNPPYMTLTLPIMFPIVVAAVFLLSSAIYTFSKNDDKPLPKDVSISIWSIIILGVLLAILF